LKLAQKLPKYKYIPNFNEIDILKYHHKNIQEKISSFLSLLEETKKESRIKNVLLESLFETEESTSLAEIASSLIQDPLLPNKLLSQKKLLIEGIFYFEIEEITRQLSLIDHENLRRLVRNGYKNLFKEGENSSYILSIILREKQFNCYILLTILNQSNKVIRSFIDLMPWEDT
jgi:hypothetical protein